MIQKKYIISFILLLYWLSQAQNTQPRDYIIPSIDLDKQTFRQVGVDREPGQYLGHPTTVLLENNQTIIAVSDDDGQNWPSVLFHNKELPARTLFWKHGQKKVARKGPLNW